MKQDNKHKIRVGQVYRQKEECIPDYRKHDSRVFVITNIDMNIISGINTAGVYQKVLGIDWLEKDCELLAEYPTWIKAVNSKEFTKGVKDDTRSK